MYAEIASCPELIVGTKQVLRALESDGANKIFIANDADTFVLQKITAALRGREIEIVRVDSMKELGKACKIEVGAAVAAIPKAT